MIERVEPGNQRCSPSLPAPPSGQNARRHRRRKAVQATDRHARRLLHRPLQAHQLFTKPVICEAGVELVAPQSSIGCCFLPAFQCLPSATGTGLSRRAGCPASNIATGRHRPCGRADSTPPEVALRDQTGTGHKTNARLTRGNMAAHNTGQRVAVGKPDGLIAKMRGALHHFLRMRAALQKLKLKSLSARQSPYFHHSRKHPVHEPAHTSGFAPVKPVTINPEATPVTIFHAEIITGQAVMLARRGPPFGLMRSGPCARATSCRHAASETGRAHLGNLGNHLNGFGRTQHESGRVCGSGAVAVDRPASSASPESGAACTGR